MNSTLPKALHLILLLSLGLASSSYCADDEVIQVSQDFTEALALVLTKNTSVEVVRSIPVAYSPDTHEGYIKKHWETFADIAKRADCVLTISSAWPKDPLYAWARRANVRIIPIDVTSPLDRSRAGLPLLKLPEGRRNSTFAVFESPGNCSRMADIASSDLVKIFPRHAATIESNLKSFKRALFQLRTSYEVAFGQLTALEVISLTSGSLYLTDEFGLSTVAFFLKSEIRWQKNDYLLLADTIARTEARVVLGSWKPSEAVAKTLARAGACFVLEKRFVLNDRHRALDELLSHYAENLQHLLEGFKAVQL